MKAISLLFLVLACSKMKELEEKYKDRPLHEQNLVQCYLESDTYMEKKPFDAKMSILISDLGTVTDARVITTSTKDANLSACLRYVMMGAGRSLKLGEKPGPKVKEYKFKPDGKHVL